jgi:hypothetical protein
MMGRRRHGSQKTGMAAGVKPRSREAVRVFAQGFTRDESPGEDECRVLWVERGMGHWWSVHMQPGRMRPNQSFSCCISDRINLHLSGVVGCKDMAAQQFFIFLTSGLCA